MPGFRSCRRRACRVGGRARRRAHGCLRADGAGPGDRDAARHATGRAGRAGRPCALRHADGLRPEDDGAGRAGQARHRHDPTGARDRDRCTRRGADPLGPTHRAPRVPRRAAQPGHRRAGRGQGAARCERGARVQGVGRRAGQRRARDVARGGRPPRRESRSPPDLDVRRLRARRRRDARSAQAGARPGDPDHVTAARRREEASSTPRPHRSRR